MENTTPVRIEIKLVTGKWQVLVDGITSGSDPPWMIWGPSDSFDSLQQAVAWVNQRFGKLAMRG